MGRRRDCLAGLAPEIGGSPPRLRCDALPRTTDGDDRQVAYISLRKGRKARVSAPFPSRLSVRKPIHWEGLSLYRPGRRGRTDPGTGGEGELGPRARRIAEQPARGHVHEIRMNPSRECCSQDGSAPGRWNTPKGTERSYKISSSKCRLSSIEIPPSDVGQAFHQPDTHQQCENAHAKEEYEQYQQSNIP